MKKIILSGLLLFPLMNLSAQKLTDKETLQVNDSVTLHVGDDVIINKPMAYDFVNISLVKKKKFSLSKVANVGMAAGSTLGIAGANAGSIGAMQTGVKAMQASSIVGSAGWTQDAINLLNASEQAKSIVGQKMRILKFKKEGNEKRGEYFYAILAGHDDQDYSVDVAPALQSGEILLITK